MGAPIFSVSEKNDYLSLSFMNKRCFIISPIGAEGTEVREHADDVFEFIIKPAMEKCGFDAYRSDQLNEPGRISKQMFDAILGDDLCIAVLTGYNPNVFYELAIAQFAGRPVVMMIEKGNMLPFDIKDLRCVYYDLKPKPLRDKVYENEIIDHVKSFEKAGWEIPLLFQNEALKRAALGDINSYDDLSVALNDFLKKAGEIESLDIFSHSSQAFFQHIRPKLKGTEKIRIIIRNPKAEPFIIHKKDRKAVESEKSQINNAILSWTDLITTGRVTEGHIYLYDFEPSFFLSILNKRVALFGFYRPTQYEWGFSVKNSFIVENSTENGIALLESFSSWFNAVLTEKTQPCEK